MISFSRAIPARGAVRAQCGRVAARSHSSPIALQFFLAASLVGSACSDRASDPDVRSDLGPGITIEVAALELPGVSDACYDLSVTNALGQPVWSRPSVCASSYGAGADITYVAPCDATSGPGGAAAINTVTLTIASLSGPSGPITDFVDPCSAPHNPQGCQLPVLCRENADAPVTFNLTLMRRANQGFFDVAVNFADVFCSAKVDCQDGDADELRLVFDPTSGERVPSVVMGFACTDGAPVGAATSTHLYREPVRVVCGSSTFVVDPSGGPGNLYPGGVGAPEPLVQAMVFEGVESLTNGATGAPAGKLFWNVALGLDLPWLASQAPGTTCRLQTAMTASEGPLPGGVTPAGGVYPYLEVDVPLWTTGPTGQRQCTKHPLDGEPMGVATAFTGGGAEAGRAFPFAAALVDGAVVTSPTPAASDCRVGGANACDDDDPCTTDTCDAVDGSCDHVAVVDCPFDECLGGLCGPVSCAAGERCGGDGECTSCGAACQGRAAQFDSTGNVRVTHLVTLPGGALAAAGDFFGATDFDPGPGEAVRTPSGPGDGFVAVYDAAGALDWVATWGGTGYLNVEGLARDGAGRLHVAGSAYAGIIDFDPGASEVLRTVTGSADGYVLTLDATGAFVRVRTWGGRGDLTYAYGVVVDASDNIYATGSSGNQGAVFEGAAGDPMPVGSPSLYVVSYSAAGDFRWATSWGSNSGRAVDIALSSDGALLLTGSAGGTGDWDPGPGEEVSSALGTDAFVARLALDGQSGWTRFIRSASQNERGFAVLGGPCGSVIAAGMFGGTADLDPGAGESLITAPGSYAAYALRLEADGTFSWGHAWGGENNAYALALAPDGQGGLVVGGNFGGTITFDAGPGAQLMAPGAGGFATGLSFDGAWRWAAGLAANNVEVLSLALDGERNLYVGAGFSGVVDVDPGPGTTNLTSVGDQNNGLLWRLGPGGAYAP